MSLRNDLAREMYEALAPVAEKEEGRPICPWTHATKLAKTEWRALADYVLANFTRKPKGRKSK